MAIGSALIGGGLSLLGGLFGGASRRKAQERQAAEQQIEGAREREERAIQNLSAGQQKAFQTLISSFGQALGR